MNLHFLYLMNLLIFARLILTFRDKGITVKEIIYISAFQIFGFLIYNITWLTILIVVVIAVVNFMFFYLEWKKGLFYELRLLSLLIYIFIYSIVSAPFISLEFNHNVLRFLTSLKYYSILIIPAENIDWLKTGMISLGLLLVLNEANLFIRYIFQKINIVPMSKSTSGVQEGIDKREYNNGRIIGILERIIVYILIINNEFTAIGLIMAAKGFTRFKELDERKFAEYILIGNYYQY